MIKIEACRHGRMMFYSNDHYIGGSLEKYGEYSEGEIALWRQFIKPGMTVVDVGANIGCFTVPLAKLVGPQGRCFAIEPQRQFYQMLTGNLALNEISNTMVLLGAFAAKSGTVNVPAQDYSKVGNFGALELASGIGETVPCVTLDSMIGEGAVHFIKIDVEGMERDVLAGAKATLHRDRPILYVENDRDDKSGDLINWLLGADYRLFWHLPPLFNPSNYRNDAENIFGAIVSMNMLAIHGSRSLNISGLREIKSASDASHVRH